MTRAAIHPLAVHPDAKGARRLRGATNLDAGVVVAAVPPGIRRSYELTWALLEAFGKRPDVSGAGREEDLNWELVAVWSLAHRIRHLVLVDAQWLPGFALSTVAGLAAVTGTELWLVAQHPLDDAYVEALGNWPTEVLPASALVGVLEAARPAPEEAEFPRVPADNYPTFRAEARRRLDKASFAVVDARYRTAYEAAKAWFGQRRADGALIDENSVVGLVRGELRSCSSAEEMLVAVRGIQAAAHRSGWLVSADLPRLVVTAEKASARAVHSPATWQRLLVYREPYRGAACALAGCDLALDTMLGVTLADVADDGATVVVTRHGATEHVKVPSGARLFLQALALHRQLQGAGPHELLFADEDGPMTRRYLANAIRYPVTEVGVALYSQQVERAEPDPKRWSGRFGLSVQELR